jgi:hypothetical protein
LHIVFRRLAHKASLFARSKQGNSLRCAWRVSAKEESMNEQQTGRPPRFGLGQVRATYGALAALAAAGRTPNEFLRRHQTGDWGDLMDEDAQENELALLDDYRLLSAYDLGNGIRIWLITEWDRSATTLLLPQEY